MTTTKTYPIQKTTLKNCLSNLDGRWEQFRMTNDRDDYLYYLGMRNMFYALTVNNGLELNRDEDGKHYLKETGYFEIQIPLDKHGNPDKIIEQFKEALAKNTTTIVEE